MVVVLFGFFSPLYTIAQRINAAGNSWERWIYLTNEEKQAFDYLLQNTTADSGVLASYQVANYIPAVTNNRVFLGLGVQTNMTDKLHALQIFYSGKLSQNDAKLFLQREHIDYVFWGPGEMALSEKQKFPYSFLKTVYENEKVKIFSAH